jgi:hypothetical protein
MTQRFLRNRGLALSATALLFTALSLSFPAGAGMPLAEFLKSAHVHGLAVECSESRRLLIANHYRRHAVRIDSGRSDPVSEHRDDLMGFAPHPVDANILYVSGHPSAAETFILLPPQMEAEPEKSFPLVSAARAVFTRWTSARSTLT